MSDPPPPFHVSRAKLKELMQCKGGVNIPQKIADDFGDIKSLWNGLLTNPETGIKGDADDIAQRKAAYGVNVIRTKKPKSIWKLIWSAMNDLTLVTLMVAALVSFILAFIAPPEKSSDVVVTESHSNWIEGAAIMVSVVLVVLITAYNDHKKENQFQALKDRIDKEVKCSVIRSGQPTNVLVSDLVIGDVCQVKYGDLIPADGIIVASNDLKMDESSLTGESDHVKKDSINNPLIFSGTHVMEGSGRMVVTAVGVDSEAGNIMKMLGNVSKTKEEKAQERLQKKENEKAKKLKNRAPKVSPNSQQAVITISEAGDEANDIQMSMLNDQQVSSDDQPHGGEDGVVAGTGPSHEHDGPSQVEESDGGKSVLQMKLTKLSSSIGFAGTIIALLTVLILFTRHTIDTYLVDKQEFALSQLNDYVKHLIIGITVLVVAIPEGLPLAVTISLACSVKRMTKDNNLVRHLDACETMGNATTICSDKTGTLTTNQMTAVDAYIAAVRHLDRLPKLVDLPHKVAALLGDAITINCAYTSRITPSEVVGEPPKQMGNKTECALLGFLLDLGIDYQAIRETNPEEKLHKVYTFNSARKSMSTVIRLPDSAGFRVYTKGASEIVLKRCTYIHGKEGNLEEFTAEKQASLLKQVIEPMAEGGLRTICVAYKDYRFKTTQPNEIEISSEPDWEADECINANFTCLAIVGIEDPVRPEVPQAIRQCQDAGITVRMVTGDNLHTARSIAIKCGIVTPEDDFLVLEGRQFNERIRDINGDVRQELFDQVWPRLRVLARSSPADKYTLVKHIIASKLNTKREVVAVTGDGTNDGPALKMADVGFAMGIAGTDVAKEASDIIITDDNFSSIVKAVMWGRNVYDSIAKFLQFQLTVNVVAVVVAFVGACAIEDSPLKAVQMLWVSINNQLYAGEATRHCYCGGGWEYCYRAGGSSKILEPVPHCRYNSTMPNQVNLIMDTFASIAMANETLSNDLLKRQPYGRKKALISKRMAVNIVGQSLYQLVVIFSILFWGHQWFDFPSALIEEHRDAGPTEHFSFIFNVFVLMTIFNEVNCRKIHGERNIAAGLLGNIYFCVIILGSIIVQVIIFLVPFCRSIFHLTALTGPQWGWSVLLGVSVLLWNQVLITIPPDSVWVCHLWRRHPAVGGAVDPAKELKSGSRSPRADGDYALRKRDLEVIVSESRLNWCRGIKRIQYQLRVMHAFQEEISRTPPLRTKNVAGPGGMVRSKTQTSMRSNVSNSNLLQSSTSPTAV